MGGPPAKDFVSQTLPHAATLLGLPVRSINSAPPWGEHAPRRGGPQYFGAAGVEVWRAQASEGTPRPRSSRILRTPTPRR
eukprot:5079258-Alexandrium_andersonii.AAC.1